MQTSLLPSAQQSIYQAALFELKQLQREMDYQQIRKESRQSKRLRHGGLLAGGMLLSSLLTSLTVQAALPMIVPEHQPLPHAEMEALDHLIDYVAVRMAANDVLIAKALCARFGVDAIAELHTADYDEAVVYLLRLAQ